MKNILLLVVIFSFFLFPVFGQHPTSNQQPTEIQIHYFNNYPFSFKNKAGQIEGIEVDILNAFVKWMKTEKSIELKVQYQNFNEFSVFYKSIIAAPPNVVGLGSVSITTNRQKEVSFTPPYLKNKSILVSQ